MGAGRAYTLPPQNVEEVRLKKIGRLSVTRVLGCGGVRSVQRASGANALASSPKKRKKKICFNLCKTADHFSSYTAHTDQLLKPMSFSSSRRGFTRSHFSRPVLASTKHETSERVFRKQLDEIWLVHFHFVIRFRYQFESATKMGAVLLGGLRIRGSGTHRIQRLQSRQVLAALHHLLAVDAKPVLADLHQS